MVLFWGALLFLSLSTEVRSANILTIIPFPSYSHQQPLLSVSMELARRGHNLTVITTDPPKEVLPNYKVIDISSAYGQFTVFAEKIGFTLQKEWNAFIFVRLLAPLYEAVCDYELGLPQVQDFIRNANKTDYDLILIEDLMYSSYGGLAHKIGSPPVIGIHTFPPWSVTDLSMGVPVNPSYMPDMFVGYTDEMDFFQRVYNTIFYWWMVYQAEMRIYPLQEKVLRKYFGDGPPPARDFEFNKSLILMPTDLTLAHPQPLPPNVIQIGPLHIREPKPLPKDLEEWFSGATDGVVYFSLGSNMKGTSLKEEKRDAFVKAFAKFPKMRFVWKWESEEKIPGLSSNVLTRKWLPQQDLFGHPKLRLFITQGGLQSAEEIVHHGVPVLGIPLFGDQRHNMWKLAKEGAAISLEMHEVSADSVHDALNKILYQDKQSYKENAMKLSKRAKDQLIPAMETAVWWVEYVIRHNGARHLRVASLMLTWYQLASIDVYLFLLTLFLMAVFILLFITKSLLLVFSKTNVKEDKIKKN